MSSITRLPHLPSSRISGLIALFIVSISTYFIYQPGLSGDFIFDDNIHIVENQDIQRPLDTKENVLKAALSFPNPVYKRPLTMLSLAMNHHLTGLDPYYFKLSNLFIHIANGIVLYFLSMAIFAALNERRKLQVSTNHAVAASLACTTLWLIAPINLTPVLYVVQRMSSLSAFFVLIGLLLYTRGRILALRDAGGRSLIGMAYALALLGAVLAKENGILLVIYFFVIEWSLLDFKYARQRDGRIFNTLLFFAICLPLAAFLLITLNNPERFFGGYSYRDFTLSERLLTEPRVLLLYLKMMLLPRMSEFGLFHDDIVVSQNLLSPVSTLPALLFLLTALAAGIFTRKTMPLASFGILFFLSAHALESTVFPLEIAHEHRNYLASIGLFLPLCYFVFARLPQKGLRLTARLLFAGLLALSAYTTHSRATAWSNKLEHAVVMARFHPDSARSNFQLGSIYWELFKSDPEKHVRLGEAAYAHFINASQLWRYNRSGYLVTSFVALNGLGKPVDASASGEALELLTSEPVSDFTASSVVALIDCQAQKTCDFDTDFVFEIASKASANNRTKPKGRARIMASAAQYAYNIGKLEQAVAYAEMAQNTYPQHLQHALNLSMLYINTGRHEDADRLLDKVSDNDSLKDYSNEVLRQRSMIDHLRSVQERGSINKL